MYKVTKFPGLEAEISETLKKKLFDSLDLYSRLGKFCKKQVSLTWAYVELVGQAHKHLHAPHCTSGLSFVWEMQPTSHHEIQSSDCLISVWWWTFSFKGGPSEVPKDKKSCPNT